MIQTQTLAADEATKAELRLISEQIAKHRNDPERYAALIAQHDEIVKRLGLKLYSQSEDT